jgi:hypothetical protein
VTTPVASSCGIGEVRYVYKYTFPSNLMFYVASRAGGVHKRVHCGASMKPWNRGAGNGITWRSRGASRRCATIPVRRKNVAPVRIE